MYKQDLTQYTDMILNDEGLYTIRHNTDLLVALAGLYTYTDKQGDLNDETYNVKTSCC